MAIGRTWLSRTKLSNLVLQAQQQPHAAHQLVAARWTAKVFPKKGSARAQPSQMHRAATNAQPTQPPSTGWLSLQFGRRRSCRDAAPSDTSEHADSTHASTAEAPSSRRTSCSSGNSDPADPARQLMQPAHFPATDLHHSNDQLQPHAAQQPQCTTSSQAAAAVSAVRAALAEVGELVAQQAQQLIPEAREELHRQQRRLAEAKRLLVEADEQLVGSKACLGRACQLQVQQQEEEAAALEQMRQQAAAAWPASLTALARARAVLRDAEAEQAAAELECAHVQRVREAWRSRYNRMLCSYRPPGRKERFSHLRLMWVSWGFPFNYLA
ncbi:hypothetical protein ACK3TF_001246 [Chlorella vulgaris]